MHQRLTHREEKLVTLLYGHSHLQSLEMVWNNLEMTLSRPFGSKFEILNRLQFWVKSYKMFVLLGLMERNLIMWTFSSWKRCGCRKCLCISISRLTSHTLLRKFLSELETASMSFKKSNLSTLKSRLVGSLSSFKKKDQAVRYWNPTSRPCLSKLPSFKTSTVAETRISGKSKSSLYVKSITIVICIRTFKLLRWHNSLLFVESLFSFMK